MLNKLKSMAADFLADGEKALSRVTDKNAFKRAVYAGYLVADADGDFDKDEKKALSRFIADKMPHFSISDIISVIEDCESKVSFDSDLGKAEILDFIGKASGDEAESILRLVCFIGKSDGDFDADERMVGRDIAVRLGLSPSRYGI